MSCRWKCVSTKGTSAIGHGPPFCLGRCPANALGNGLPASPAAFGHRNSQRHARSRPSEPRMPGKCNIVSIHNSGYGSFQVSLADRDGPLGPRICACGGKSFRAGRISWSHSALPRAMRSSGNACIGVARIEKRWNSQSADGSERVAQSAGYWFAIPPAAASEGPGDCRFPRIALGRINKARGLIEISSELSADKTACASR